MTSKRTAQEILAILEPLVKTLRSEETLTSEDPSFISHTQPFGVQHDRKPPVAFAPQSTAALSSIIRFLYQTDLQFNVRGRGYRSPSATDVIVSTMNFRTIEYDQEAKIATVGVGATWKEVVEYMEKVDPEYSVVSAKTPAIGVGGVLTNGGFSWMSSEFGLCSDPLNFLDAEVVQWNGSVVKASDDPDLLWALRGGGGGFGVMTKVFLRAHEYPTDIWSGTVLVPFEQAEELTRRLSDFADSRPHPKVTMHLYVVRAKMLKTMVEVDDVPNEDMLALHVYDALGEQHGRKAFHWVLDMPGVIDQTKVVNMRGVVNMQRDASMLHGKFKNYYATIGLPRVDAREALRTMEWFQDLKRVEEEIQDCSFVALEILIHRSPLGGRHLAAFPRPSELNSMVLLATGSPATGTVDQDNLAKKLAAEALREIFGATKASEAIMFPAGLESYHDSRMTYREHYDRLLDLRDRYDPNHRFTGHVNRETRNEARSTPNPAA